MTLQQADLYYEKTFGEPNERKILFPLALTILFLFNVLFSTCIRMDN